MADYLTRVAEAVRDACAAEAFMETTLAVEYVSATCPGEIISNMILNNIDLQAVIASVPRPEMAAKYFAYDQEVGFDLYDTASEAKKAAQESVDEYRSEAAEGWNEAVENVCWGVVLEKTREVEIHDGYDGSTGLAGCGRPVDYVLASEPVAAQPAVPDGLLTAADMKHLRRFAECAEDCDGHDVPKEDMKRLERLGAVRSLGFGRHETTAFGDAMLAATPVAPQPAAPLGTPQNPICIDSEEMARLAEFAGISVDNREDAAGILLWVGEHQDDDGTVGYGLCASLEDYPEEGCYPLVELPRMQTADGAATLRSAIRAMAAMLQAREWAEHVSTDPVVTDLEVQITELVGTATKLREQNAALVAAVEATLFHVNNNTATINSSVVCELYDALAIAEGGAA